MNIKLIIAAALALGVTACSSEHHSRKYYHLEDGRYAYNNGDVWYYMYLTNVSGPANTPLPAVSFAPSGVSTNVWTKGSAPSASTLKTAEELDEEEAAQLNEQVPEPEPEVVAEENQPDQAAEGEAQESAGDTSGDSGDTGGDSGGDSGGGGDAGGGE